MAKAIVCDTTLVVKSCCCKHKTLLIQALKGQICKKLQLNVALTKTLCLYSNQLFCNQLVSNMQFNSSPSKLVQSFIGAFSTQKNKKKTSYKSSPRYISNNQLGGCIEASKHCLLCQRPLICFLTEKPFNHPNKVNSINKTISTQINEHEEETSWLTIKTKSKTP